MKLLLSSAGIKNPSIQSALVELLGKPIAESDALCIPTAAYGHPQVGPEGPCSRPWVDAEDFHGARLGAGPDVSCPRETDRRRPS